MGTREESTTIGKVITCKAAVAWEPKGEFVVQDVQVEPPHAMEVRIKVTHSSLCRSDVFFWANEGLAHTFPRIFGHEAAGIVESVGEGITDLRPGDHVLPIFTGECRECKYCASPKTNLCSKFGVASLETGMKSDGKSRFSVQGKPISRFLGSTFSEYTVVEYAYVVKINPAAPLDKVCLLGCGVTAGIGAVRKIAQMEAGATVAVFGLGTVGLAVVKEAKLQGASRIIGVDNKASKADEGKRFGITDFLNPDTLNKPVDEEIRELTEGGVDFAFECVGNPNVMATAFESCQDGWGTTIVIGVAGRATVTIPTRYLLSGRCMKGTLYGGYKPKTDVPELVEQYLRKDLDVEEFITHNLPFTRINEAFKLLLAGDSLRTVLHFDDIIR
ncbi:hypothetical protein M758_1G239300 [Ceratodon purpureus]|nr:hypothetical protein M758_1G239300 [Ceratodon purpureus]